MAEGLSLEDATIGASGRIRGAQAVVAISRGEPDKLTAFRQGNAGGIVVGYGDGEMLVASDLPALLPHTRTVAYLAGGEAVTVTPTEARYSALSGGDIAKNPSTVPLRSPGGRQGTVQTLHAQGDPRAAGSRIERHEGQGSRSTLAR